MTAQPFFDIAEKEHEKRANFDPDQTEAYTGPESRRANRRGHNDRRQQIRFELENSDRRKNPGRRKSDSTVYY